MVIFGHNATQEQMSLLLTTTLPLRSLTFAPCDRASCIMLRQPVRARETHHIHLRTVSPRNSSHTTTPVRSGLLRWTVERMQHRSASRNICIVTPSSPAQDCMSSHTAAA